MRRWPIALILVLALGLLPVAATRAGTTVRDVARIESQGESVLWGVGLVVGLPGTGDSGKDLAVARPLAEILRNGGVPIGDLSELKNAKSAAIVDVICRIPENGARPNDAFDVVVNVKLSAKSLKGGRLFLTPLRGPFRGSAVYAIAEGAIVLDDPATPTSGRVRLGARIREEINTSGISGDSFNLILRPEFAGFAASTEIAGSITQAIYGKTGRDLASLPAVATALDDRTIRIDIPPSERTNRVAFIGDVMSTRVNAALLKLPAQVIVNQDSGAIVVTGNVEISPVAITHKDLTITTTIPAPVATPQNPLVETTRWTKAGTGISPADNAKLTDLLTAFKQLNIPARDQIAILQMLHKGGQLQARLIID